MIILDIEGMEKLEESIYLIAKHLQDHPYAVDLHVALAELHAIRTKAERTRKAQNEKSKQLINEKRKTNKNYARGTRS